MKVEDVRIGMNVMINGYEANNPYCVAEIMSFLGGYYATLHNEDKSKTLYVIVDKITPLYEEKPKALDWKDIRKIVKLADAELERHSKKELITMGEEAYYTEVAKAYLAYKMDMQNISNKTK